MTNRTTEPDQEVPLYPNSRLLAAAVLVTPASALFAITAAHLDLHLLLQAANIAILSPTIPGWLAYLITCALQANRSRDAALRNTYLIRLATAAMLMSIAAFAWSLVTGLNHLTGLAVIVFPAAAALYATLLLLRATGRRTDGSQPRR